MKNCISLMIVVVAFIIGGLYDTELIEESEQMKPEQICIEEPQVRITCLAQAPVQEEEKEPSFYPVKTSVATASEEEMAMAHSPEVESELEALAKVVHAEAGNQDIIGRALVARVVMNRVESETFPDTIKDVVFQKNQFSTTFDGAFDKAEPTADDWQAVNMVMQGWDDSQGALFFEAKSNSTWHRKNLKFLFQHQDHYFYK